MKNVNELKWCDGDKCRKQTDGLLKSCPYYLEPQYGSIKKQQCVCIFPKYDADTCFDAYYTAMTSSEKYVVALDVGTTTIRCHIYNTSGNTISKAKKELRLLHPQHGYVEIDPQTIWDDVQKVVRQSLLNAQVPTENGRTSLEASQMSCMGIATQRATFITWRKDSGEPFHNFITWKDLRAQDLVKAWNKSLTIKTFRSAAYLLYMFSGSKRFLAGSKLPLSNIQVTLRLVWVLNNIPEIQKEIQRNNVMFGTMETWLLYKLTGGKTYVSDCTNASSTGMYDPFICDWSGFAQFIFNIPKSILPPPVANDYDFGSTDEKIFGYSIPIKCLIADQQASMFGCCCFSKDVMKITLGTGTFLDIQTEHPSVGNSFYTLLAFSTKDGTVNMCEGSCNDTGSLIQWALKAGLCSDCTETTSIALSVKSTGGVYFIPAFSGLGPPIYDDKAGSGFIGIKPTTTKAQLLRAILESIVFRIVLEFEAMKRELGCSPKLIKVDGGVSNNDFICQMIADMTDLKVERLLDTELTSLGAAYIAGVNQGIWKDKNKLISLQVIAMTFMPTKKTEIKKRYFDELGKWKKAVDRFKGWYI